MPHEYTPQMTTDYLTNKGYNPSSPKRSEEIAKYILQDLLHINKKLREKAQNAEISYELTYNFPTDTSGANLVMGPVARSVSTEDFEYPIAKSEPDDVWFALNIEALMTRHQQNRRNCLKRMQSAMMEVSLMQNSVVFGGLLITNIAERAKFVHLDNVRQHDDVIRHVNDTIDNLKRIDNRSDDTDVMGCFVVDYDGMSAAELFEDTPAPQENSGTHYDVMIRRISNEIDKTFVGLPDPQTDSVEDFTERGEGRTIEFKDPRASTENITKVAVSMLNTDGGVILVGIDDNGDPTGIPNTDQTLHNISNTFYERLGGQLGDVVMEIEDVEGDDVILIRIPPSTDTLYEVNGRFYIRIGESKKPMTSEVAKQFFTQRFNENPSDYLS